MDLFTTTALSILAAGFFVGIVVGLTGMGGGALMTPALIFLGVGDAATVVTADLTAAAIYKSGGAAVHAKKGSPNLTLAMWLIIGSVPMALIGPHLVAAVTDDAEELDYVLKMSIGFALLLAASTYALRLYINLRRIRGGAAHAVIVRGKSIGPVTDLTQNLVENVAGSYIAINTDTTLPERVRAIAERVVADHQKMANKYEVEFTGDIRMVQPIINVSATREGVQLEMSGRRPF